MIGQTVSHYRILSKLGEGGMGMVYAAEDMHLGRHVAIKFLHASSSDHHYRARFLREARAISSLSHPHIATVYDYGETTDGQPFLVMELIQGETLGELLEASALTLWRAVEIVEYVADALDEAHQRGIVHRDIKPSNVLVTDRGQVKVLDFGLAKRMNEENHQDTDQDARTLLATHTRDGVVVGTPLYLSPEQATGAEVDGRSDLFALGALLYECIAGKPAFSGSSVIEIGAQVLHIDPPPPSSINPEVSRELDRITLKALAKKAAERYQTAAEMRDDLAAVRSLLSTDGQRIPRVRQTHGAGQRTSALRTISTSLRQPRISVFTLVIGVLAIGLLVTGLVWMLRTKKPPPSAEALVFYEKGTNFLREGAYYQASKSLEKAISIDDKFALAHARLAEAYSELDYTDKAKDELLKVNTLVPDRSALDKLDGLYLEAINATAVADFARAAYLYSQLAEARPDQAEVHVDLGRAYEKNEEIDKALESYLEATKLDEQYAPAFLRAAVVYIRKQNVESATATLNGAASLYEALGNMEGRTEVLYLRGVLLTETSKPGEARAVLEQALNLTGSTGNETQKINILLQLSRLSYSEGATDKALTSANEALTFAEQRGLGNSAIIALLDLGNAYNASNDYGKAEEIFRRALDLAQRNKGGRLEARCKLNLGGNLMQQLRTNEGLPLVEEALAVFQQGNYQKYISFSLTYLGRGHRGKGEYEQAIQRFQQKLQLAQASGINSEIAFAQGEIATVLAKQERYPESLRSYDESCAIIKSSATNKGVGNRQVLAYNRMNQGHVLWQLGRYQEAGASLDEASKYAEHPDGTYKAVLAEIQMLNAQIALSQRNFDRAKEFSLRAIEKAGKAYVGVAIGSKITLGLAQSYSGNAREGRRNCEEALQMAERTGDESLILDAMLGLAEALYQNGDTGEALTRALQVQERLARSGEQESEWRAWLIAALATLRAGDRQLASERLSRVTAALAKLQQQWGAEAFDRYQTRPDIQFFRKQHSDALSAVQ